MTVMLQAEHIWLLYSWDDNFDMRWFCQWCCGRPQIAVTVTRGPDMSNG